MNTQRNRGGAAKIGSEQDGAIVEMFQHAGKMMVVKEKSLYSFRMAHDIDPNGLNPNLPPSAQQLVVALGTESELFTRTFLLGTRLLKPEYILPAINTEKALQSCLDVLLEAYELFMEIEDYLQSENAADELYQAKRNSQPSIAVPSIPNVKTRCKTIFQKADHVLQSTMDMVRLFYPEFPVNHYYSQLRDFVTDKYGVADPFASFLTKAFPHIKLIRDIRNCLDHRKIKITIQDYELQVDGSILSPTLEMDDKGSKLERVALSQILAAVYKNVVDIFEQTTCYLALKHTNHNSLLKAQLVFIPLEKRRNKFLKYCFYSPSPFQPDDGFYHQ